MICQLEKMALYIIPAIFFIIADRFMKVLALMMGTGQEVPLVGEFFRFKFTGNNYIALSVPIGCWILNIIIILIILGLIYFWLVLIKKQQIRSAGFLTFLLFGAISNIYDRVQYGFVIDYFDLKWFTIFNLA